MRGCKTMWEPGSSEEPGSEVLKGARCVVDPSGMRFAVEVSGMRFVVEVSGISSEC